MPKNEAKIIITGDSASAIGALDKVGQKTETVIGTMKKNWLAVSAVIAASAATAYKAWDYINLGAKAEQAEESFRRVAASYNENADKILAAMKRVSAGTVDDSDIMQKAVKGMVQGLSGDQLTRIMQAARISARLTGEDVGNAYETITDAIANQLPRALIRYGLVTKEQMKIVNQAIAAGVEDIDLYTLAMANAEKQSASFGAITKTTSEELQQLNAMINNVKENLGVGLYRAIYGVGLAFIETAKMLTAPLAIIEKGMNAIGVGGTLWQDTFAEQSRIADDWRNKMLGMSGSAEKLGGDVSAADKKIKEMMENLERQIGLKKAAEDAKRLQENIAKLNEEIRKQIASDLSPVQQIEWQAAEWKKLGADRVLIEKYVNNELEKLNLAYGKKITEQNEQRDAAELETAKKTIADEIDFRKTLEEEITNVTGSELDIRLAENQKHFDQLRDDARQYITDRAEMEKALTKITELEAAQRAKILEEKTFTQGVDAGVQEYLKSLEWGYERGNDMALENIRQMDDALMKMFDNPKEAMDDLFEYFKYTLKRMIVEALASEITIPLATQLTGAQAGIAGVLGGSSAGALIGGAGIGAITGGMIGGGGTGATLGGLAGGALAAGPGFVPMSTGIMSTLGISTISASLLNIAIPVIGAALGAAIGGLVEDLISSGHSPNLQLGQGGTPNQAWTTKFGEGDFALRQWDEIGKKNTDTILQIFDTMRTQFKTVMQDMGMDLGKLDEQWKSTMADADSNLQKVIQRWLGEYAQFLTGIDFKKFQQSGEEMADTIGRIIDAMYGFKTLNESIDLLTEAIETNYDEIALWKRSLAEADEDIRQLRQSLSEAVDPSDIVQYGNELTQAIYNRYQLEMQFVQGLSASIEDLKNQLADLTLSQTQTMIRLSQLGGGTNLTGVADRLKTTFFDIYDKFVGIGSGEQKVAWAEQMIGIAESWLQVSEEAIRQMYEPAIEANEKQMEAINKQLTVIRAWEQLNESVHRTLLDLKTSLASPQDVMERLGIAGSEVGRLQGLYAGASGEQKAGYGADLQEALQNYLKIAQEAYQRPSTEYQNIFGSVISQLEALEASSSGYAEQARSLEQQLVSLQEENIRLQQAMQKDIDGLQPTIRGAAEWLSQAVVEAYNLQMGQIQTQIGSLQGTLQSVIGSKSVGEYLTDLQTATVTELQAIKTLMQTQWSLTGLPAYAEGGIAWTPQVATLAERGPEIIMPLDKYQPGGTTVTVQLTVAPQVTIHGTDEATAHDYALETKNILIDSLRDGEGRVIVMSLAEQVARKARNG